ncbi:hypothetical protein GQ43DRAFT_438792 [Delitschia confertaspora ATCC 74209]|uniref:DUF7730 domain-containing protein n=1 Tax=Delitschia confertaspora ATCC 74209 TaxID=1513339 RepID=A0A9P4MUW1_9PLEO|nr:hypothetical protein GQ43DRAFT_438792 [Delitschia confertaspora ATCC 74209]
MTDTPMVDVPPPPSKRPRVSVASTAHNGPYPSPATFREGSFSLLLSLPRELRDRIYTYALSSKSPSSWPNPVTPFPPRNLNPALLRTCRYVYEEAAPILYANNKFCFEHPSDCTVFRVIASPYSECIESVCFRIRSKDVRLWTQYLGSGKKERSLQADIPRLRNLWIFLRCPNMTPLPQGQQILQHIQLIHQQSQAVINQLLNQQGHYQAPGQGQLQGHAGHHGPLHPQPVPPVLNVFTNNQQQIPPIPPNSFSFAHANQAPPPPGLQPVPPPQPNLVQNAVGVPPPPPPFLPQIFAQNPLAHPFVLPNGHGGHQHFIFNPREVANASSLTTLLTYFLARTSSREMGLQDLAFSLGGRTPVGTEIKVVCMVRLSRVEMEMIRERFPNEWAVDKEGESRTKFRKIWGMDISIEFVWS